MASFRLAVELTSQDITNGLGYFVTFSLPSGALPPDADFEKDPAFSDWKNDVLDVVTRAGDLPFSGDDWTRKVAIAQMMNELAELNDRHIFQIGFKNNVPAVEIHSSNPHDPRLALDFTDRDGGFTLEHHKAARGGFGRIRENGRHFVTDVNNFDFPFEAAPETALPPPSRKAFIPQPPRM